MFQLHFSMDNDAFGDTDASRSEEVGRILGTTADSIIRRDRGYDPFDIGVWHPVRDLNGNAVGEWAIFEEGADSEN